MEEGERRGWVNTASAAVSDYTTAGLLMPLYFQLFLSTHWAGSTVMCGCVIQWREVRGELTLRLKCADKVNESKRTTSRNRRREKLLSDLT